MHGNKPPTREDLEFELLNARINASSGYNDGWTIEMYKERVKRLEEKLKSIGKQLTFDFNNI